MRDIEEFLAQALALPVHDRAEIAERILASLDGVDEGVDEAWARELERRCAAVDAGELVTSDWRAVRFRIERDIFGR